jgi:hypothetical protein
MFEFEFGNSNLKFELKFGGHNTLTSLITSIQKLFKTRLRYDSYKFSLRMLTSIDPEGKCEFGWPHTPNFEVNP